VSAADGSDWATFERYEVDARRGAAGILEQLDRAVSGLLRRFDIARIGVGFGGPIDPTTGRVIKSHQIHGWDGLALGAWCAEHWRRPTRFGNDCDVAALAEARYGAGRGQPTVFYVTVGTGVGGGLVSGGRIFGGGRPAVAEIGHLRPGLAADLPALTVESVASGRGIEAAARAALGGEPAPGWEAAWRGLAPDGPQLEHGRETPPSPWHSGERAGVRGEKANAEVISPSFLSDPRPLPPARSETPAPDGLSANDPQFQDDLLRRAGGDLGQITARFVAEAAAAGNLVALEILNGACRTLGWAIAQVITLLAPNVVVVGGGVALIGEELFFAPLRREIERYVFPPLAGSCAIVPAALGECVVVHGAVALAAED
jgi:glucokinase